MKIPLFTRYSAHSLHSSVQLSSKSSYSKSSYSPLYLAMSALLFVAACSGNHTVQNNQIDKQASEQGALAPTKKLIKLNANELINLPSDSSAHWLTHDLLVLPKSNESYHYQLLSKQLLSKELRSKKAAITSTETTPETNEFTAIDLSPVNLPEELASKFPHLADFQAFTVQLTPADSKHWLKSQILVVATDATQSNSEVVASSQAKKIAYVQTGPVIDALYTQGDNDADEVTDLGATIVRTKVSNKVSSQSEQTKNSADLNVSFKLWAPTAQAVSVQLFDDNLQPLAGGNIAMIEDTHTGIWQAITGSEASYAFYKYQIDVYHPETKQVESLSVTDPYSLSLSVNSEYSQVVDLNDPVTQPENWLTHPIPTVKNVEDNVFYETHIRDFSSNDPQLSNAVFKGKYKAFSENNSAGIKHLKSLQKAGLNNIHLLPTYDIGTVNEDPAMRLSLDDNLAKVCSIAPQTTLCQQPYNAEQSIKSLLNSYSVEGEQAQLLVSELREVDDYNWGYDPYHYTVPEGSYAVDAQGVARLVEFREMVQSLHNLGFRVIMDVVYNHTYEAGLKPKSVLDKIVPQYYHRLDPITAKIEQSTCCDNTATERVMMAKLMTDSLVVWAKDYKIDGFRFDLMGHQPKDAMLVAREAVRAVDSDTYFYGEGWNFGEVASNSQFIQASQLELGGTEIGTFSDRLRDAVRGGGNNTRDTQGVGNGLATFPNDKQSTKSQVEIQQEQTLRMDQLRIGLAGNLINFPLKTVIDVSITDEKNGESIVVLGKDVPYGDQPTGYALDPADTINYVSKHDNQTLWDNSQYRLAFDVSTEDRVRMHVQSLSYALFAQGIPFIHMGSEFMRSKSFLRDSYDYSDWFNRVDFTKQENYYNVGLPPAVKDEANWPLIQEVMKGHQGRDQVNAKQIEQSSNTFIDLLAIRMNSPLFRLTSEQSIIDKVSFLNAATDTEQPDLIVMKIDDTQGEAVAPNVESLMVIFNTSSTEQVFNYAKAQGYQLHPIQKNGSDEVVKQAKITKKGFVVPPLSSVVFVKMASQ
ncbi:pullulanase-type alpha-1,6-glucosidase [Colwellia sp. E2M01]|uniref:pullulanase-type alpha-1,6-glucosidase n=1 Tax=Colwellia sp. E2M01 TaxID=2841561 RepID=UPI001C0A638A|nr:pullulanase-type alpha-1,6-glucosidase [Colwellia sp. E2M01]MBU2870764.1 pullulanase-type alpha-1,6-glucosidase [Colwellia sp. E2M01]